MVIYISGYYSIIYHFILINFEINIVPIVLFFFFDSRDYYVVLAANEIDCTY